MPTEPTPKRRTPVWWLVMAIAVACAIYLVIPAYRDYHPNSPICQAIAVTAGADKLPSGCKAPVFPITLAVLIVVAGSWLANQVGRRA
ncbi:MAG TPA: hypothetical protein VL241_00115 [Gemmatimonadales bacterium]|nr:hypothetical protein [Gemmatimonadales bacterium]